MAEEKDQKGTEADTENNAGGDSQVAETTQDSKTEKDEPQKIDYEEQYKRLQADHTLRSQQLADANARITELEQPKEEPEEDLDVDDEGFVDKKAVNKIVNAAVQKAVGRVRTQSANTYFRRNHKDLVKHENVIAGLLRNPKNPDRLKGASPEERIDAAVEEFNALTEEAKAEAKTEAEAEAKAKEEAKRKASGLGSTATSTPTKGDEEISDEQELKNRKIQSAKRRGLV